MAGAATTASSRAPPTFAISRVRRFRPSMSSCLRRPASPAPEREPQDENCEPPEAPVMEISMPYDLKHAVHIHYNFKEARFEGAPANFADLLAPKKSGGGGATAALSASISSLARTGKTPAKRSRTASSAAATPANTKSCNTGAATPTSSYCHAPPPQGQAQACNPDAADADPLVLLNQHFKLHFRQVPRVEVPGYDDRIPAVLLMLQEHFVAKKGYLLPHIFRESPSKSDRDQAMREINSGQFAGASHDVRVLADLIKLWFRELPVPIFHEIRSDQMEQILAAGGDTATRVVALLGALERCIVLWLADLLAHVAEHQAQNHMGVDQLAIVIAPNLVRIETENPMLAVALSKASVDLFRAVLRARFEARRRHAASGGELLAAAAEAAEGSAPPTSAAAS